MIRFVVGLDCTRDADDWSGAVNYQAASIWLLFPSLAQNTAAALVTLFLTLRDAAPV